MATPADADLIIKLYDLRREATMRKARNFYVVDFFPKSANDILALAPEQHAFYRQVTSYWEMAAAMVNHGSIDKALFYDTEAEFIFVWVKIADFIGDLRKQMFPGYLINLEKLVAESPNSAERIKRVKERINEIERKVKQ